MFLKRSHCIQNLSPSKKRKKEAWTGRPMQETKISFLLPPLSSSLSQLLPCKAVSFQTQCSHIYSSYYD